LGSLPSYQSRRPTARHSGFNALLAGSVALIAPAIVTVFAVTTLPEQAAGAAQFRRSHPSAWLVPRFWEQGLLYGPQSTPGKPQGAKKKRAGEPALF